MYRKREAKIAEAICSDSNRDRVFSYVVLFVISLVSVIMGFILNGLIVSLSKNMDTTTSNINTMVSEVVLIRKEIADMANHMKTIDNSVGSMSSDMRTMSADISNMEKNIKNMDTSTKNLKDDIHEINKLNPARLF